MDRRQFLHQFGSASLLLATGRLAAQTLQHNPFTLGVASGSPSEDGCVLWTRLMPNSTAELAEPLPKAPIEVRWELASDPEFRRIVQSGSALAEPAWGHSVHVEVNGLASTAETPWFWYRFRVADAFSAAGRTRTLPPRTHAAPLRLALASCQNYEHGYFSAYRHMAREDLDLVLFVGDYIYEYGPTPGRVRQHNSATCTTLQAYRKRYALYKSDPDLQSAHAAFPWIVTWDDHEVANDYANDQAESGRGEAFLARRNAAYRAYWENMPLRNAQKPRGNHMQLYRRYHWGSTADLHMLDARQYRDHQVCTPDNEAGSRTLARADCPALQDPRWSLLGTEQECWLADGITRSQTTFNIVGQQSLMAQMLTPPRVATDNQRADAIWNDSWDGYPAARSRALEVWGQKKNVISLGGDVHATYVSQLRRDFDNDQSPILATEFVGTSITSPSWSQNRTERVMRENPHIQFGKSDQRGYTVLQIADQQANAQMRVVNDVRTPDSVISTAASFVVQASQPGAQRA